jgi:hypothetical protein
LYDRRNCIGDPTRTELIYADELVPPELATPICPIRLLKDPEVRYYIDLYNAWRQFGSTAFHRPGGLGAQAARDVEALSLMRDALTRYQLPKKDSPSAG